MESIYIKLKNFVADDKLKEAIQELKELATENGIIKYASGQPHLFSHPPPP